MFSSIFRYLVNKSIIGVIFIECFGMVWDWNFRKMIQLLPHVAVLLAINVLFFSFLIILGEMPSKKYRNCQAEKALLQSVPNARTEWILHLREELVSDIIRVFSRLLLTNSAPFGFSWYPPCRLRQHPWTSRAEKLYYTQLQSALRIFQCHFILWFKIVQDSFSNIEK